MSCVHNTTEFKYCPECGIKIDNDESIVSELNEIYNKYKQNLEDNYVEHNFMLHFNRYLTDKYKWRCDVIYDEWSDKFYSIKEYITMTYDKNLSHIGTRIIKYENNIFKLYETNSGFDYIRSSIINGNKITNFENNIKQILNLNNNFNKDEIDNTLFHLKDIRNTIKRLKNISKYGLKQIFDNLIDSLD
jgi:predicted nucleic acid-binding Zn ribbon protein